jgi:hypothetical protein
MVSIELFQGRDGASPAKIRVFLAEVVADPSFWLQKRTHPTTYHVSSDFKVFRPSDCS